MSDAIARLLRLAAEDPAGTETHVAIYRDVCTGAADEIERLRAQRDEAFADRVREANAVDCLQAALREIAMTHGSPEWMREVASAALSGKGKTEWQDITTAPTDGTVVRLRFPGGEEAVAPWPPSGPLSLPERKTLIKQGEWPDYRTWVPTHWKPYENDRDH